MVRRLLTAAALVLLAGTAAAADEGALRATDSRAERGDLPAGIEPWWPSRYGADDETGSLNEITPAVVQAAAALVRAGTVVDLGRVLDEDAPKFKGRYWHQTVDVSAPYTNLRRADASAQGWGRNAINWITEIQSGTFQVGTQLDSIGHIQIGDRFYNGWRARDVVESWGLNRFGIESVPPIVTRGILLDIAALKGVDRLEPGYVISVDDANAALTRAGLVVKPGDAVLIHTGWGSLWGVDNARFLAGEPGPGLALIDWLYARHVALVGTDCWSIGPVPGEDPERPFLVPQTMYVRLGLFGVENLATEQLARRAIHEFQFVLTHGRTRGSTAAVVAPAAVF